MPLHPRSFSVHIVDCLQSIWSRVRSPWMHYLDRMPSLHPGLKATDCALPGNLRNFAKFRQILQNSNADLGLFFGYQKPQAAHGAKRVFKTCSEGSGPHVQPEAVNKCLFYAQDVPVVNPTRAVLCAKWNVAA
jgi:hypothetical protein